MGTGIALQIVFTLLILKSTPGRIAFETLGDGFSTLLCFTYEGFALIALIAVINYLLGGLGHLLHLNKLITATTDGQFKKLSLEAIFSYLFAPVTWVMGIEASGILARCSAKRSL